MAIDYEVDLTEKGNSHYRGRVRKYDTVDPETTIDTVNFSDVILDSAEDKESFNQWVWDKFKAQAEEASPTVAIATATRSDLIAKDVVEASKE